MKRLHILAAVFIISLLSIASFAEHTIESIKADCSPLEKIKIDSRGGEARECKPMESGLFAKLNGKEYHFVLYCVIPAHSADTTCGGRDTASRSYERRALAIFSKAPGSKALVKEFEKVDADVTLNYYDMPYVLGAGGETVLTIPIHLDGTANGNLSEHYALKGKSWIKIDSTSWLDDLNKRVPAGLAIQKGVWPNLKTMTAEAPLYNPEDANCCPTGGTATATLAIAKNKFVLKSVRVAKAKPSP